MKIADVFDDPLPRVGRYDDDGRSAQRQHDARTVDDDDADNAYYRYHREKPFDGHTCFGCGAAVDHFKTGNAMQPIEVRDRGTSQRHYCPQMWRLRR